MSVSLSVRLLEHVCLSVCQVVGTCLSLCLTGCWNMSVSLSVRLFMEILNDCSDVDEIKFQEDGTWCPIRPRKEALSVSSTCIPKIEPRLCAVVPSHSELSSTNKKADVIDLTLESSSEEEEEEEEPDPPLKKRCLYMSKTEEVHAKG
ncbi:unnamed protein product [Oncorhynchus mykiss]|uniref:Uncharacterized protein n=1 Tax=Oncorhynchus mykiss TaxID=8022 RepID=A0A060Z717_ONCMY|nr:unnamed protein product [Oncorhynchus mykiss]